jgi:CMP/dCMP kinase
VTDLRLRDESDRERTQPAADAVVIDTSSLEVDDVVARIERLVRERQAA